MSYLDNVFSWAATRYEKGIKADLYALLTVIDQPVSAAASYGTGNGTLQYVPEQAEQTEHRDAKQSAYYEGVISITLAADGTTYPLRVRIQLPSPPANSGGPGRYTLSIRSGPAAPAVLTADGAPGGTDPGPPPTGPAGGSPDRGGPAPYGTLTILGSGDRSRPAGDGGPRTGPLALTLRLSPSAPMFG